MLQPQARSFKQDDTQYILYTLSVYEIVHGI